MRWILPALLLISLSCCKGKDEIPNKILKPEKMEVVFWDIINADVYVNDFLRKDTSLDPKAESIRLQMIVFNKHKVTRDEFYKSYAYYANHPGLMKNVIDSMVAKKEKIKRPAGSNKLEL